MTESAPAAPPKSARSHSDGLSLSPTCAYLHLLHLVLLDHHPLVARGAVVSHVGHELARAQIVHVHPHGLHAVVREHVLLHGLALDGHVGFLLFPES